MRLNRLAEDGPVPSPSPGQAPSAGPGGGPKLASTPAEKNAAAGVIESDLLPSTKKAGDHADEATTAAAGSLSGWVTATALKKTLTTWDGQVKMLLGRLGAERDGLRNTVTILSGVDTGRRDVINGIKTPSVFDSYR
ncbi:hypothetical protein [Streptomyces paludis]|uniref:WXG100 family type VII secretion target n=1 Tax=Streptomyces paludis TaxID=2282738 RepID=A0A345HMH0_9ACTN|nr:hypothetical protein [Streptomyces paludis]AXG77894.1 hypothetical protein DVK44_09500 [Streptomyces paludis]